MSVKLVEMRTHKHYTTGKLTIKDKQDWKPSKDEGDDDELKETLKEAANQKDNHAKDKKTKSS